MSLVPHVKRTPAKGPQVPRQSLFARWVLRREHFTVGRSHVAVWCLYDHENLVFDGQAGVNRVLRPNMILTACTQNTAVATLLRAGLDLADTHVATTAIVTQTTGDLYLALARDPASV